MSGDTAGNTGKQLKRLRGLHAELRGSRAVYDFQMPALVSHVNDYAADPARLQRYASSVVGARLMHLLALTFMKTYQLVSGYLWGIDEGNPYVPLMAARAQIEIYAVTWDVLQTVAANRGMEPASSFAVRVKVVDEALINATHGTRLELMKRALRSLPGTSGLRAVRDSDMKAFEARNILSRIDRLSKGAMPDCREQYDRLCEYLHPNIGQNVILLTESPTAADCVRIERSAKRITSSVLAVSVYPMAECATRCVEGFRNLEPPFGLPSVRPQA